MWHVGAVGRWVTEWSDEELLRRFVKFVVSDAINKDYTEWFFWVIGRARITCQKRAGAEGDI
jgi:hypothetical protein